MTTAAAGSRQAAGYSVNQRSGSVEGAADRAEPADRAAGLLDLGKAQRVAAAQSPAASADGYPKPKRRPRKVPVDPPGQTSREQRNSGETG